MNSLIPSFLTRTKVICTLGPATASLPQISELIQAGMSIARLNFSHGTHKEHEQQATWVREESSRLGKHVAILQDLQGPKLRIGKMEPGTILRENTEFTLTTVDRVGNSSGASVSYPPLVQEVKKGQRILLDDGQIQLEVLRTTDTDVMTRVLVGGTLTDHKGINVPDTVLGVPAFSEKDQEDLRWGLAFGVDLVALSFVRTPMDISTVRDFIKNHAKGDILQHPPLLIAKIEKAEAIQNIDDILLQADGVMVARGDLGVEIGPEKVPLLQKDLIETANRQGKLVITATQMLESMTEHIRPTRAEASDVANAVLDGTDAVMLSGETAQGKHPTQVVKTMVDILQEVEKSKRFSLLLPTEPCLQESKMECAIAHSAAVCAKQLQVSAIFVKEDTGEVVKLLSDYRPSAIIFVDTQHPRIARQLSAYWGVHPIKQETSQVVQDFSGNQFLSIKVETKPQKSYTLMVR